jgi:hypothetical protein
MGWGAIPKSVWDFKENFISSGGCRGVGVVWFLFGAKCWTLWGLIEMILSLIIS